MCHNLVRVLPYYWRLWRLGMGAISCMQVVVRCERVSHLDLCTLERQSLCESHRQRRWLTCWSYMNWMETHFNVQRRLYDYQFSLTTTPAEFEQAHRAFMELYNTTAHQGLLKDRCDPPIPLAVLGETKGRLYSPEELSQKFTHALWPRTTNRYVCVTLHSYHFYVEEGLPKTRVLLWVYGEQLRAMFDNVVIAEYRCHYDWRTHKVHDIREGSFYP